MKSIIPAAGLGTRFLPGTKVTPKEMLPVLDKPVIQYVVEEALAPAEVLSVTLLDEGKSCRVVVPESQLSLAIGKEGQNARLAAKLTGYKIDIKSDAEA